MARRGSHTKESLLYLVVQLIIVCSREIAKPQHQPSGHVAFGSFACALRFDTAAHSLKADFVGYGTVSPIKEIFRHRREVSIFGPVLRPVPSVATVPTNLLQ
jgi:hypothetical protein